MTHRDYIIYQDTDSCYAEAAPLMPEGLSDERKKQYTIAVAKYMENALNTFYDSMARRMFNCETHRFRIKGESVMETGFWVAKKRYAMKKVYDLETDRDIVSDKPKVTGLDVVRSSFPPAFGKFMSGILMDILNKVPKADVDAKVLTFKDSLKTINYLSIARNTAVNNLIKFEDPNWTNLTEFPKGATAHAKAAISYNRLLKHYGIADKYQPILNRDKIKWVYLRRNPLQLESMALKGDGDPPEIIALVEKYIDHEKLFEAELKSKLQDFYAAMGWGDIPTEINQIATEFFSFEMT